MRCPHVWMPGPRKLTTPKQKQSPEIISSRHGLVTAALHVPINNNSERDLNVSKPERLREQS